jgi:autophagy-related protein 11
MQGEIQRLKRSLDETGSQKQQESERQNQLERELRQARAHAESEATARRIIEERNQDLSKEIDNQRLALSKAFTDAAEQSKGTERMKQELTQARAEFEEVKALESRNAAKVAALLEEQGNTLRKLEEARSRGEDLEAQIQAARAESDDVRQALKDTSNEKERLLKVQASEHDRIIRDHIAEADGDRAILERQLFELKTTQDYAERQIKDLRAEIEVANSDASGLREELQRVEIELRDAKHVERLLREDIKAGRASQSDYERRLEDISRLVAQILDVAISFRNTQVKALTAAQTMSSLPTPGGKHGGPNVMDSMMASGMRHHGVMAETGEPSPIDPSDPSSALEILREFDHDHFLEAIHKTGSTIKKWQKQCKEYRERAKGKISFRNFAKGDLALFLPTRNSISKPWAAFNGMYSFEPFRTIVLIFLPVSIIPTLLPAGHRSPC